MAHPKILIVWAVLCATTLVSTLAASGGPVSAPVGLAVLAAAFAKVYLVLHYFMELEHAPWPWPAPFIAWTAIVLIVLGALFLGAA